MKKVPINILQVILVLFLFAGQLLACARNPVQQSGQPGKPEPQGTLTLYDIGPITLDPALSLEMRSHFYVVHVFSGLVSLDENLKVLPEIASRWEISQDGKTYTFFLRPEAMFQNGKAIKAEDVKFSWERAADPRTKSPTAETYLVDILGVEDVLQGKAQQIKGVTVIDDYRLRVELKEPRPSFLAKITYPVAFVVDREDVRRGGEWWRKPNGSGAFKVLQWRVDDLLELEANELYFGEGPRLKKVVFRLYGGVPLRMYEQNEIDAVDVGTSNIDKVRDVSNPLYKEMKIYPELSFYFLAFNVTKPPFDDENVRKAFVQAIDRAKILGLTLKNTVRPAKGIIPVGMPGFNPGLEGPEYNVQAARELLAQSRYGGAARLPPVTLTTSGRGAAVSDFLSAAVQQWKQNLGVDIEVRVLEPEVYYYNTKEIVDNIYDYGWVADYPDPENFLEVLFHSDRRNNAGGYHNAQVDALLDRAAVERDEARRIQQYREAEEIIVRDAVILPLWNGQNFVLTKPNVQNYRYSGLGFPLLNKVYVGAPEAPTPAPSPTLAATPRITPAPSPALTPGPASPVPVTPGGPGIVLIIAVVALFLIVGMVVYYMMRKRKGKINSDES